MRKRLMIIFLILTAVLTSGTHCNGEPHATPTGPPNTPFNPPVARPQPDHRPTPPKTPGPAPADPNPGDKHQCTIFVSWTPAKLFVEVDWEPNGPFLPKEVSGGEFSRNLTVYGNKRCSVQAEWTELSNKANPKPGRLNCLVSFDGNVSEGGRDEWIGPGGDVYCSDSAD